MTSQEKEKLNTFARKIAECHPYLYDVNYLNAIPFYRSFSSSSCRLKWTAVIKAVKGTRPAKVTISIILPPAQCIILNNSAKLNKLMVVAPNL